MTENNELTILTGIFKDVLENDNIRLEATTTANDIEEWDSVSHLILIHAIEEKFNIRFSIDDIINFRTAGDICESIKSKRNK